MSKKKFLTLSATFAAAIALAGCAGGSGTGSSPTSSAGVDHGSSMATATSTATSSTAAAADHTAADVTFAQTMIPHHTQAVEMSDMMLKKDGIPASVTALATKIKAAQGPEIQTMTGWLTGWNEPTMMPSGHAGHSMNGMMSDADIKALNAAKGTEAARLFLKQMIAHHEGAVMMARTESTAGKSPDAVQLSKDIVSAQEAEIQEMQKLLATL
jgi:uncharacterized protein (DUF305 family)